MSDHYEIAYIENLDGESCGNLIRLVAKLDPTETEDDGRTPRWNEEERALILGSQEASSYDGGEDDDEESEDTDEQPTGDTSPYDTVVIITDEQAAALGTLPDDNTKY